ncbi:AMP-binding protein [Tsukamurella tyrosinosolvens]|uniref:AMP-binding protein n=1 Tax=Tsukamurella tyrosinosolvens TaxID=57704 RepID=UPI0007957274|nr:AMP-binding protein [Tsukamurella tyrosinosolvens]KXP08426.1 hypothetical protein AXK59_23795 [Tsukamurella tyrosinosolvens]
MSILAVLERGRRFAGGEPAMIAGDTVVGYDELIERVSAGARALRARGLGRGDRIAVVSGNDPRALIASYSALAAGATFVPVAGGYTASEIVATLDRFDCSALIYQDALAQSIESIRNDLHEDLLLVRIETGAAPGTSPDPVFADLIAEGRGTPMALPAPRLCDTGWLGLTGGTTGVPKGVELSWLALNAFIQKFGAEFPGRPRTLIGAPLTHGGGILAMSVFGRGGTLVVANGIVPDEYLRLLEEQRITETFLPPTAIYKLLDHPGVRDRDFSALRTLLYGAAPSSPRRIREAIGVFGPVLTQMYGQTECHTMISVLRPENHFVDGDVTGEIADDARLSSCGLPSLGTIVEIRDGERAVGAGEVGEVCVSSDLAMSGYYKNPAETAKTLVAGFVHTGDVGYLDAEGFLHIVDRKKDMVITGGFNVYPAEVENVLRRRADVADCAVFGVPDEYWGESLVAAVRLVDGAAFDEPALVASLRDELGAVKTPRRIIVLDQLPQSAVGKVLKKELREIFLAGQGQ